MNRHERTSATRDAFPDAGLPLAQIDASHRVWNRILDRRTVDRDAGDDADWTPGERAASSLYGSLLDRAEGRPFIYAQVGQSLDGRIATPSGDARNVSSADGLVHLHRCRAIADAVLVGVGTAISDDPRLTVRLAAGPNPARVIVDPGGRLQDDAAVLAEDGARRVVVQCCDRSRPSGVEVVRLKADGDGIPPERIAEALHGLGIRRLLVEGGGNTIGRFLAARLVDRLHVSISPLIIGDGPSGLRIAAPECLAEAVRPRARVYGLGGDILFDCSFG